LFGGARRQKLNKPGYWLGLHWRLAKQTPAIHGQQGARFRQHAATLQVYSCGTQMDGKRQLIVPQQFRRSDFGCAAHQPQSLRSRFDEPTTH
jgi:hypothetical protein